MSQTAATKTRNTSTARKRMNTWAVEQFGLPAQMHPEKLEVPKVSANDVLIRMRGAEIGDWDAAAISGDWDVGRRTFPLVVGLAGAGTVAAAGKDVLGFAEGEAERENFARFAEFALKRNPETLEAVINRPIYPRNVALLK